MTRTDLGDGGLGKLHVAWFDHFLRGADNGVLDEPPGAALPHGPRGVHRRTGVARPRRRHAVLPAGGPERKRGVA